MSDINSRSVCRFLMSGVLLGGVLCGSSLLSAKEYYVGADGDDSNVGSEAAPFATVERARAVVRKDVKRGKEPITVVIEGGRYFLDDTLVFSAEDSGNEGAEVVYRSAEGEAVILSGGVDLSGLEWVTYRDGILRADVGAAFYTDQLIVEGKPMPMARYPNYDPEARFFGGVAEDAFSAEKAAGWEHPEGGYMHAMHSHLWGGMHYKILGKDESGALVYEGGWQNNRKSAPHKEVRFVENIFEELDAPGEWYLNQEEGTLYFYPPDGVDLKSAEMIGVRLDHLVEFQGTEEAPVHHISLNGIQFSHAARTFMENKERMLRTDWTVYRGGALLLTGTEDCVIEDCVVREVGGNAIFVNNYNRRLEIKGSRIYQAGGNGIAFVGDPAAVRNGLVGYATRARFDEIDKTPGPITNNYPADSVVEDCLIHEIGQVEKQTAGVEIDMAMHITVRHCSIYDMPRAGINIGDGCWGGHLIEYCDVFDTVLETGDHGSFNSWGRDRFWGLKGIDLNTVTQGEWKDLPLLDVIHPNVIRNSRWRCDHGWDIDLDDGSSNYHIYNNLCLNGGIKNREGFYRTVENNVIVNNGLHPHVWYKYSEDVFRKNIVFENYAPAIMPMTDPWGREVDYNFRHTLKGAGPATELSFMSGRDEHSMKGDALFVDAANGDYRVKDGSPALALGFVNFKMDVFGVESARLKAIARTAPLPDPAKYQPRRSDKDGRPVKWFGATVKNLIGMGDVSATGLPNDHGVLIVKLAGDGEAAKAGLKRSDVILRCGETGTNDKLDLIRAWAKLSGEVELEVWRNQELVKVVVKKS